MVIFHSYVKLPEDKVCGKQCNWVEGIEIARLSPQDSTSIPVVGGCRYPCQSLMTTCSTIFPYRYHLCWYHIQKYKLLCIAMSVLLVLLTSFKYLYHVCNACMWLSSSCCRRAAAATLCSSTGHSSVSPVRQGSQFLATENAGDASEVNILEGYSRSTPRYLSHRISGHTRCHTLSMRS